MYCEICKNNFNKHYFGLHLKKEHKINSKEYYDKYLKNENKGICCECGNETTFISLLNGYRKFCSYICRSSSNIIKEKIKQTNLEKYGVENVFSSNEIKNKIKQTNLNKFGVENPSQNEEIKEKIKQTNLEKYNVENVFQLSNTKEKIKQTHNEKYINKHKNIDILSINNNLITFKCKICNNICTENKLFIYRRNINKVSLCSYCLTKNNTFSFKEKELVEYIKSIYNGEIIENDRNILNGQELDVYLPMKKLAFEFNGLYWHSELFIKNDYHLKKTEECEKQGIQLVHIFEDEWEYKQDIIKNKIKSLLNLNERIYARKCIIKEINSKDSETFLNENYIQSFYNSKYNYGLYYNDELVSVMCFNESKNEFILTNFCSKLNKNIIGGSSKLFKYFLNKYNKNIITFIDRHYTSGDLYKKLGFKLNNIIKPSQYQFIDNISKNKQKIYKIYNCGYLKYIYYK